MSIVKSVAILALLLVAAAVAAQDVATEPVGSVRSLVGRADVTRGEEPAAALATGDPVFAKDTVRTKQNAALLIVMNDGSRLTLGENNRLKIAEYVTGEQPSGLIDLLRGRLRSVVTDAFAERRGSFKVRTSNAIMGVQGTEFTVDARPAATRVLVHESKVSVEGAGGRRVLSDNEYTVVRRERPPSGPVEAPLTVGSGSSRFLRGGAGALFDPF